MLERRNNPGGGVFRVINKYMITKYDTLQQVVSCLLIHSTWIKKIIANFDLIERNFNLRDTDKIALREFFKIDHEKLLIHAQLSEEKRWREFLTTSHYVKLFFGIDKLKRYWTEYLTSFHFKEGIPSTPFNEAVCFLEFMEKKSNALEKKIIEYEITKNRLVGFNFYHDQISSIKRYKIAMEDVFSHELFLNPSLVIKKFKLHTLQLLKNIDLSIAQSLEGKNDNNIYLGFYKNCRTGSIKTIAINKHILKLLIYMKNKQQLYVILQLLEDNKKWSFQKGTDFINYLHQENVIFIVKK